MISSDLPDYLRTSFSPVGPIVSHVSSKDYKTGLRVGVSQESPRHFQGRFTHVLSNDDKNKEKLGKMYDPDYVYSKLKRNNVKVKSPFRSEDINSVVDYHTLKLSSVLDLVADKAPRLRRLANFRVEYREKAKEGFGRGRGECSVCAGSLNLKRQTKDSMYFFQKRVEFSVRKERVKREMSVREAKTEFTGESWRKGPSSFRKDFRVVNNAEMRELDDFERRGRRLDSIEKRSMYNLT